MAINPAIAKLAAKLALQAATDEEARKKLIMIIIAPFIAVLLFLALFVYILTSPFSLLSSFFESEGDKTVIEQYKAENSDKIMLQKGVLAFNGKYPMPAIGEITSSYGMRIHPVTKQYTMHTGIDLGAFVKII